MPYEVSFSPSFPRKLKRASSQYRAEVKAQTKLVCENPLIGIEKAGDLKGIFVHKFKFNRQENLLSYKFDEGSRTILLVGTHENY